MVSVQAMLRLTVQNVRRWRMRLLTVVLLVAIATVLYILYGAYLENSVISVVMNVERVDVPYFDMLVRLQPDQHPLEREELPATRYQREIYGHAEAAHSMAVSSVLGIQEMVGLEDDTAFFPFAPEEIQGRRPETQGELLIPRSLAARAGIDLGQEIVVTFVTPAEAEKAAMRVVGIYAERGLFTPLLCRLDDVQRYSGAEALNSYFINYNKESDTTLEHLQEWMTAAYPRTAQLSTLTPQQLAREVQSRARDSEASLSGFVLLFMGVSVFTISLMTFLERRAELATLKTIGISANQMTALLYQETFYAALIGLLAGSVLSYTALSNLGWSLQASQNVVFSLTFTVILLTLVIISLSLIFPIQTSRVASVSQLLHARTIPLRTSEVNYLEHPLPAQVYRERRDNVRILQLPIEGEVLHFKRLGDSVKAGEVIAQRMSLGGYLLQAWASPCDGVVTEIAVNGTMTIKPDDPETAFHNYPSALLEKGKAQAQRFAALEAKAEPVALVTSLRPEN